MKTNKHNNISWLGTRICALLGDNFPNSLDRFYSNPYYNADFSDENVVWMLCNIADNEMPALHKMIGEATGIGVVIKVFKPFRDNDENYGRPIAFMTQERYDNTWGSFLKESS